MRKEITILFLSSLLCTTTIAQNDQSVVGKNELQRLISNNVNEEIHVHLNSKYFIVGEAILFRAYCSIPNFKRVSNLSKILYVELIDELASPVLRTKILLEDGVGNGDFFLPSSLASGNYTMIAYTDWMRNFSKASFFQVQVSIINPFKKTDNDNLDKEYIDDTLRDKTRLISNQMLVELKMSKKTFALREKVEIQLFLKDTFQFDASVSIRKADSELPFSGNGNNHPAKIIDSLKSKRQSFYLPSVRGDLISGRITKSNGLTPVSGKMVYATIPDKQFYFAACISDSSGRFYFNSTKVKRNSEVLVQLDSLDCANCKIQLDQYGLDDYSSFKPHRLKVDTAIRSILEERSIAMQVENSYYEVKQDSVLDLSMPKRFYGKADYIYKLDDFVRFPTMEDVVVEYISEIVLKRKNGKAEMKVLDVRRRSVYDGKPLILIDGVPVFDQEIVMNYDPLLVETIEVVGRHYFYGPLEVFGIISICTYDGNAKNLKVASKFKHVGLQPSKKYYAPNYSVDSKSLERTPDYRVQLYWNPSMVIDKHPARIQFYTSDIAGEYELTIESIDLGGNLVSFREMFRVNDEMKKN